VTNPPGGPLFPALQTGYGSDESVIIDRGPALTSWATFIGPCATDRRSGSPSSLMLAQMGRSAPDRPYLDRIRRRDKFAFSDSLGMEWSGCVSIECLKPKQLT
jgi:hypothetical protein